MATPKRRQFVIGNWKMYKTATESLVYAHKFLKLMAPSTAIIGLAVPFTSIAPLAKALSGSGVVVGAQNMHDGLEGAYTGEISAAMLHDAGAEFVLLGHSERRHLFGENNAFINRKVKSALEAGILPVLCIGETLEEREKGQTSQVLRNQLLHSLSGLNAQQIVNVVIAYEPIWAIGTGKTATPEQAQAEHAFCRSLLAGEWSETTSEKISLLYGGSVKPENAASLMAQADIDGLLVGGASLNPEVFIEIVNVCK